MKKSAIVIRRYAKALYGLAAEKGKADSVENELSQLHELFEKSEPLADFMDNPNISAEAKADVIRQAFDGTLSAYVYNTVRLLLERGRELLIPDLFHAYVEIADEAQGRASALVTSTRALTEEEQNHISEVFSRVTGKRIRVSSEVDESLLGGLTVRIGDRLFDGSLKGKLDRLQKQLDPNQAM